jgi:hypothetical protein
VNDESFEEKNWNKPSKTMLAETMALKPSMVVTDMYRYTKGHLFSVLESLSPALLQLR